MFKGKVKLGFRKTLISNIVDVKVLPEEEKLSFLAADTIEKLRQILIKNLPSHWVVLERKERGFGYKFALVHPLDKTRKKVEQRVRKEAKALGI